MSPRMPMPQRPKSPARQIAELERHRRREERRLDDATSGRTGDSVVGSSNADQFTLTAPDSDGFTVTLPGGATLAWQVTVGGRAGGDATATAAVSVNSTPYPGVTLGTGDRGLHSAVLIGYGGDSFACDAVLTGTGGAVVDLEFTAIRLS